jgi:cytochrome c5
MKVIHYFFCGMLLMTISFVHADEATVSEKTEVTTPANETQTTDETQTAESPLTEVAEKGKALHERHCKFCHARLTNKKPDQLYTRLNRRVQSYASLENKVLTCVNSLGIPWFEDEMANVTAYLNEVFYQFNTETTQ